MIHCKLVSKKLARTITIKLAVVVVRAMFFVAGIDKLLYGCSTVYQRA